MLDRWEPEGGGLFVHMALLPLSPSQRRARSGLPCWRSPSLGLLSVYSIKHHIKWMEGTGQATWFPFAQAHQRGSRTFGTTCLLLQLAQLAPPGKTPASPS